MSNFNASVWPPMIFPDGIDETGNGGTATPSPAPPSVLPAAVATTEQLQGAAPEPGTVDYEASAQAQADTYALFKIYPPTYPTVSNS